MNQNFICTADSPTATTLSKLIYLHFSRPPWTASLYQEGGKD